MNERTTGAGSELHIYTVPTAGELVGVHSVVGFGSDHKSVVTAASKNLSAGEEGSKASFVTEYLIWKAIPMLSLYIRQ